MVISGFCALDDNFTDKGFTIPGPHTDPLKAYDSILKLQDFADRIIPLHSQRIINVESIP
jgi:hypothetical protein